MPIYTVTKKNNAPEFMKNIGHKLGPDLTIEQLLLILNDPNANRKMKRFAVAAIKKHKKGE